MTITNRLFESRIITFKKMFAKLKFSPALFEKIPSFVFLVFKNENKRILKLQNLFSEKTGSKILFLLMVLRVFSK